MLCPQWVPAEAEPVVKGSDHLGQKLKAYRCMHKWQILYFLGGIVEIERIDVMFTVTAIGPRNAPE